MGGIYIGVVECLEGGVFLEKTFLSESVHIVQNQPRRSKTQGGDWGACFPQLFPLLSQHSQVYTLNIYVVFKTLYKMSKKPFEVVELTFCREIIITDWYNNPHISHIKIHLLPHKLQNNTTKLSQNFHQLKNKWTLTKHIHIANTYTSCINILYKCYINTYIFYIVHIKNVRIKTKAFFLLDGLMAT